MTRNEAFALRDAVNEALELASKQKDRRKFGNVNWADLKCRDIESRHSFLSGDERETICVLIEEAAQAPLLEDFVNKRLEERGYHDIVAVADWLTP
jgi:hypothetical protein